MKTVFNNYELAHAFASRSQDSGRTTNGNFYFENGTLFSYGRHFPVAMFYGDKVLMNQDHCSHSTSQHQNIAITALRHVGIVWQHNLAAVKKITESSYEPARLELAIKAIYEISREKDSIDAKLSRMRAERRKDSARQDIFALEQSANFIWKELLGKRSDPFVATGKITASAKREKYKANLRQGHSAILRTLSTNVNGLLARWERAKPTGDCMEFRDFNNWQRMVAREHHSLFRDNIGPLQIKDSRKLIGVEWSEKTARLQELRNEKLQPLTDYYNALEGVCDSEYMRINADKVEKWLSGESDFAPARGKMILRVKNEELQTSEGANVPLQDAIKLTRAAAICRKKGIEWQRNGAKKPIGMFQTDRITAQGDLIVGCHKIPWQAIAACVARFVPELQRVIAEAES